MVFIRAMRFLAGRVPDNRTEVSGPPVLRFSFRRKRQPLLPSPPPYPNAAQPARPALSVAQLAAPINVRVFAGCPAQADFVECLASAQLDSAQALFRMRLSLLLVIFLPIHQDSIAFLGFR